MYLLLPTEEGPRGFDATLRALNPSTLESARLGLVESLVDVLLPKFKMEKNYGQNLEQVGDCCCRCPFASCMLVSVRPLKSW